ncbi:hypothetical protein HDF16_005680 [Granulicella aggregans]|uniref:Uncharacterized protein n=1 Tax=Granulicella aggregans TaxID=474949 RepID=A0A7W7ZJY7_9BACT|nr:hypothetical protein [Granulicella aggregans]
MTVVPMLIRRLLRTKQAATYLSMSEWKLRRLTQTELIPFGQDGWKRNIGRLTAQVG